MISKPFLAAAGVAALFALVACGESAGSTATSGSAPAVRSGVAAPGSGSGTTVGGAPADTTTVPPVPVVQGPRVIRNASLTVEVRNSQFDNVLTKLIDLSASEGGYVSGSDAVSDTSDRIRTGTITFAVPADKYEETIKVLRGYGTVQSFHATSQDVGGQYADLQSRLKNAEAQRDAMLALLSRATSIGDIVNIQNQVGQIEGQIEQLKGQIDYLDHATSYSTIQVTLREAAVVAPRPQDDLGLQGALHNAVTDFFVTIDFLVVALGALAPYLLLALLGFGAFTIWRRRRMVREA